MVETLDDDVEEGTEAFEVRLLNLTGGATLHPTKDHTTVFILEDDDGSCESSETALCLLGNRFQIEAAWRAPDGTSGMAQNNG